MESQGSDLNHYCKQCRLDYFVHSDCKLLKDSQHAAGKFIARLLHSLLIKCCLLTVSLDALPRLYKIMFKSGRLLRYYVLKLQA